MMAPAAAVTAILHDAMKASGTSSSQGKTSSQRGPKSSTIPKGLLSPNMVTAIATTVIARAYPMTAIRIAVPVLLLVPLLIPRTDP